MKKLKYQSKNLTLGALTEMGFVGVLIGMVTIILAFLER